MEYKSPWKQLDHWSDEMSGNNDWHERWLRNPVHHDVLSSGQTKGGDDFLELWNLKIKQQLIKQQLNFICSQSIHIINKNIELIS